MLKKNQKKQVIFIILVFVVIALIFIIPQRKKHKTEQASIVVKVQNELVDFEEEYTVNTSLPTLGEVLDDLDIAEFEEGSYGRYVIAINGMTADSSKEEWWGFLVNGEFSQTGIDSTYINDGDVYTFYFNQGY